jgi:hypothetical protein
MGKGTTEPGYRNRNGQVVARTTNLADIGESFENLVCNSLWSAQTVPQDSCGYVNVMRANGGLVGNRFERRK